MVLVHINLPDHIVDMIERVVEGKNLTDKVKNYLCSEYFNKEFLVMEQEICKVKLQHIGKMLKDNVFYDMSILSSEEKEFLSLTIETIDKNPKFIYGQREGFNNQFGKRLSMNEFKLLLYQFQEKLEKGKEIPKAKEKPTKTK